MKPKLLIVADTYYPKVDGTLKFIEEFVKRSHERFEISLLVPQFEAKPKIIPNINTVTFIEPSAYLSISDYPNIKFSFQNIQLIKNAINAADIIFVQGPAMISYLSVYYGQKLGKKTIFYTHTLAWELIEKFFPPVINKLLSASAQRISINFFNRCTMILVPYQELKEELQKQAVKTPIEVARLGVDIDLFIPAKDKRVSKEKIGLPSGKLVIGYVGRISKEKNTGVLLRAFQKLKQKENSVLLLVGNGPQDQVKPFQELPNGVVTGFVRNVQDYLKAMDIFVMPSLTETTSLATLEAMSSGLPVIASKVGFVKTYLHKNKNGLFFPRNNASILAAKIEQLAGNEELRIRLGQNARKMIAYSFSWERSINRIKKLLLN